MVVAIGRTYDLAHVRNVLSEEKLSNLFAEFLLEATPGGDENPKSSPRKWLLTGVHELIEQNCMPPFSLRA
jgi:hypothetical protein